MPNVTLRRQARQMIFDVHSFMKKQSTSQMEIIKRTAQATNTSESTVRRIIKEHKSTVLLHQGFKTPGRRRTGKKRVTGLDSVDHTAIKRCIHTYHIKNNELPTVDKLRKKLKEQNDYNGSERSLRRIFKNLGFRWKKTQNNKKVFIEKTNIRLQRIEYLQKLDEYRKEGRPIIFTDESCVESSHSSVVQPQGDGTTKGPKTPATKGQRLVIVHAGSDAGFVPNALLLFIAGAKTGDRDDYMNFNIYEEWLSSQLLPNLPPNSVLVVDNAPYHNKQFDPPPTANVKKAVMRKWLTDRGVEYEDDMLKPQLYKLIKRYSDQHKLFSLDKIMMEHNHAVLRLPQNHPDLNPFEMAWTEIKEYVGSNNVSCNIEKVHKLVVEKIEAMEAYEWTNLCENVKKIETDYLKSDRVVDLLTEKFIVCADDDSESDDSDEDDSDDNEDDDDDDEDFDDEDDDVDVKPGTSFSTLYKMEGESILPNN